MIEPSPKPLDYAPPPRKERTRLADLSLADWIILLMVAALVSGLLFLIEVQFLNPHQITVR